MEEEFGCFHVTKAPIIIYIGINTPESPGLIPPLTLLIGSDVVLARTGKNVRSSLEYTQITKNTSD